MTNDAVHTLGEQVKLSGLSLSVKAKNFFEYLRVVTKYYPRNFKFAKIDTSLLLLYLANNPFSISMQFLTAQGEKDIYAYGETPLTTLEYISMVCEINAKDTVYELGCGRGRTCFWLNSFIGCKAVGIEQIPAFVHRANIIKNRFDVPGVEFRQENMLLSDYSTATVIYLYGTCLDDNTIGNLLEKFKSLSSGAKVITVSFPLTDFIQDNSFELMKRFTANFTWGEADVYLHIKK